MEFDRDPELRIPADTNYDVDPGRDLVDDGGWWVDLSVGALVIAFPFFPDGEVDFHYGARPDQSDA